MVDEPGSLPASLVREGTTMIEALATDLSRIEGSRVTVFREPRVLRLVVPRCEIIDVQSAVSQREEFERLAADADVTIIIAPEFDGILLQGCPASRWLWRPARIAKAGVHPRRSRQTRNLQAVGGSRRASAARCRPRAGPKTTSRFSISSRAEAVDGAGSQDTQFIVGPHDEPRPYAWPRRLESFVPGLAASVALLCGPIATSLFRPANSASPTMAGCDTWVANSRWQLV